MSIRVTQLVTLALYSISLLCLSSIKISSLLILFFSPIVFVFSVFVFVAFSVFSVFPSFLKSELRVCICLYFNDGTERVNGGSSFFFFPFLTS